MLQHGTSVPLIRDQQRPSLACSKAHNRAARRHSKATCKTTATAMIVPDVQVACSPAQPQVSQRVTDTDAPVIVKTKALMAGRPDVLSLAQGVVHWQPPPSALQLASHLVATDPSVNSYGPAEGLPALRDALRTKLQQQNALQGYEVMVTAGANQAFINLVLALCDPQDSVVLFRPYYFNHLMALQMTGGGCNVLLGPCSPGDLHPDLDWLQAQLQGPRPPKMVVLANPCNPTGVLLPKEDVDRLAAMCSEAGSWLVLDNTYEQFVYGGRQHYCAAGPHVINLFSFSKAYGMMGWRVGYIAYPEQAAGGGGLLGQQLLKVQDTIPICPSQLSQHVALEALAAGQEYVQQQIQGLAGNREAILDALSPLGRPGQGVAGGEGAIYFWARLPEGLADDEAVVSWLVEHAGVCVIPGSSCGAPGCIRVAYANLAPEVCAAAAARLKSGLQRLLAEGLRAGAARSGQAAQAVGASA